MIGRSILVKHYRILGSTLLAAGLCLGGPVRAGQDQGPGDPRAVENLTVTASLREQSELQLPGSTTVLGEQALQDAGLQHLESVTQMVPNLNWAGGTSRPRYFQIRGIGERSQYEGAPNPSVGFLVDDIDFSGMGGLATLFDTRQVEVLRGPQGAIYGANALAGLIAVRTVDPGENFEIKGEAMGGSDGALGAGLALGGPLSPDAGYRLVAHRFVSDGFRDNAYLGVSDTNQRDELTSRAKLHWQLGEDLVVKLTGVYVDMDNGYDAWAIDNSLVTLSDRPGRDTQRTAGLAARLEWNASDRFSLLSITTAADSEVLFSFDGDWGNDESWGQYAPYDFFSSTQRQRRTLSQEFRFISTPRGALFGGRSDWVAGAYMLDLDENNDILDTYNGDIYRELKADYQARNLALFGQLDTRLASRWTLALGLRLERREARYHDDQQVAFEPTDTMPGGHLTLSFAPGENSQLYGTLSRGYKAGGFNIGTAVPEDRREFDPEYLWNLEFGYKAAWPRHGLQGSLAAFYMDRQDAQVSTSFQVDPSDPLSFSFYNDNAAEGSNYGLEGELQWNFIQGWTAHGSLGLLRTEYRDYVTGTRVLDGRAQAHAPEYMYNLGLSYSGQRGLFARVDVAGKDGFYYSDSHDQRSDSYTLVNARIGYEAERWSAYLWGRNVFDEVYTVRGFFFANEPPDWVDKLYTRQGDPRQVGVTINYRY